MLDREVFDLRLAKLEEFLRRLKKLARVEKQEFLSNPEPQALAERWLHLSTEACLDIAQHVVAGHGWRTPNTNRDVFRVLKDEGVLSSELAAQMEGWAGLRNVLVHLYLDIDHEQIYTILTEELDQLEAFAAVLTSLLDKKSP